VSATTAGDGIEEFDVVVVGAGPVGLMLANLLGGFGVRTLVAEAREGTVTEPRAVSVDDEGMRVLQAAGLLEAAAEIVLPGTGTRYVSAAGGTLAYVRGPDRSRLGFTVKNPIYQPEFERMLLEGLGAHAAVEVRFGAELTAVEQDEDGVAATLRAPDGGEREVHAAYLVGCDGGRSRVRRELGIEMAGSSIGQPWLVVDTRNDSHRERYAIHIGDWHRPTVIVADRDGRCRYEFMLLPGEDQQRAASPEFARPLLERFRPPVEDGDLVRCTVYNFHALVASHWRRGRVLLAGDAAHMMPPFAGQGLNSGLRDVMNLGWKLAAIHRGEAGPALLDSYERERRPHTEATIALSMRLGRWMMTTDRRRARLRDGLVRAAMHVPPARRWIKEMRYKPDQRYAAGAIWKGGAGGQLVGRPIPQPQVLDPVGRPGPLDDSFGDWFALVAVDVEAPVPVDLLAPFGVRPVRLVTGDRLALHRPGWNSVATHERNAELESESGRLLLVRPDRIVAAVIEPDQLPLLAAELPRLLGTSPSTDAVGEVVV
jgi:3-(3-hydroxy-phenyl)propionate hydroxylase